MRLPKISPVMLRSQPDQTSDILNRLINEVEQQSKTINDLTTRIANLENVPTPVGPGEWHQVIPFDPTQMGTEPGWCLANVDAGFGIVDGMFPTARADMESQRANGTLHADVPPPDWIQVPVYVESGTPNGHVVVWDHGVVWSDGAIVQAGLSAWSIVYGWGELCDGHRVVSVNG